MRARSTHAAGAVVAIVLTAGAGCGGGEPQDANEPSGNFTVEVVDATFPKTQKLGRQSDLEITVRNAGDDAVPNLAVTVNGFSVRSEEPDLSDPNRPVFAVNGLPVEIGAQPDAREATPRGCDTAYVNTWACGELAPDAERTLRWTVTAVKTGPYEIDYRVAAGLNGKAKAIVSGGGPAEGNFTGTVSAKPNHTLIGPDGKTVVSE
ncbi:MAG: hypothetical protein JW895_08025 [Thermoleophilaceae bacterium]|nr:hypothetical protein [Thermoleophilaceae bacterium]